MTTYTAQAHVNFGDTWTSGNHNTLLDNIAAFWTNAAQYSIPYWSASDAVGAIALANGKVLTGSASAPAGAYPPGIELKIREGEPPFSGITAAAYEVIESTGAGTAKPIIPQLRFDAAADEGRMWVFQMTWTPAAAPILKIRYRMASANTGATVAMSAQLAAVSDGDASMSAKAFASANLGTTTCPDTANTQDELSITLTNADSIAKGDWVCLVLFRDVSEDNATGDLIVSGLEIQYG